MMQVETNSTLTRWKDELYWEGAKIDIAASNWGTPLFLFSPEKLEETVFEFSSAFRFHDIDIKLFYSMKTNPMLSVLELMHRMGIGVEVVSNHELWLARKIGFDPRRIIVNGPSKPKSLLVEAIDAQTAMINVESFAELEDLLKLSRDSNAKVGVGLRIRASSKPISFGLIRSAVEPSGIPEENITEALSLIQSSDHLHLVGLHCHLGTGIENPRAYCKGAQVLGRVARIAADLGHSLQLLDIGGGFGVPSARRLRWWDVVPLRRNPYSNKSNPRLELWKDIVSVIKSELGTVLRELRCRLCAEPGRALVATSHALVLTVNRIVEGKRFDTIFCDGGAMTLSPMLAAEVHKVALVSERDGPIRPCIIRGRMPSNLDIVSLTSQIRTPKLGDRIVVCDTGAYFVTLANNFGGPRPGVVAANNGFWYLVQRPERSDEIIDREITRHSNREYQ